MINKLIQKWGRQKGIAIKYKINYRVHNYTYKEIFKLTKQYVAYLSKIKKNQHLMIWAPNSPQWVALYFACILRGIIVVPIDYTAKEDYVQRIQKQVKAKLMITTPKHMWKIRMHQMDIDDFDSRARKCRMKPKFAKLPKKQVLEIMYTSGTTGDPKGVILTHNNIHENLKAVLKQNPLEEGNAILNTLPLSHSFAQMIGLFVPFELKAPVMHIPILSSASLTNALQREDITALIVVPRLLQAMKDRISWLAKQSHRSLILKTAHKLAGKSPNILRPYILRSIHKELGNLKYFLAGGAYLDPTLEQWWDDAGIKVLQGYGLTECSPVVSFNEPETKKAGTVGRILHNVTIKTTNDQEIVVKGPNVFQGYYKNKKKTKEVLVKDWFHTGDLGQLDEDDYLILKGRKKDMIVTSEGLNIYPEDIENILKRQPGVTDATVVGYPETAERVHAVLILKPKANARRIIETTNKKLASSQQIQDFTKWPGLEFPRTTTMKVKKFQVKQFLDQKKASKQLKSRDPVISIIQQVTKARKIKPTSKLSLDLKLSSLDRVELLAKIEEELHVSLDESSINQYTTVKELQDKVRGVTREKARKPSRWTRNRFWTALRNLIQYPMLSLLRTICHIQIKGYNNVKNLKGPILIVANHTSYFDVPCILLSLPSHLRKSVAVSAWAEFFEKRTNPLHYLTRNFLYYFGSIMFNGYLFPQSAGYRKSFEYTGELVDAGYSITLFPEGSRTLTGKMNPFKQGVGLLAPALDIPIVPVKIEGLFEIFPRNSGILGPGNVTVKFGRPFKIKETKTLKITKEIEKAVKKL